METFLTLGFSDSAEDFTLFTYHTSYRITVLLLQVDDMVVTCDENMTTISALKQTLQRWFEMKDVLDLFTFLGLLLTTLDLYYHVS